MNAWTESQKFWFPIMMIAVTLITTIITLLLKKKSLRIKLIPLQIITAIMVVAEIYKIGNSIASGSFTPWIIPLQMCSTFMLWFGMASFGKGKVAEFGKATALAVSGLFFIGFMAGPTSIIGNSTDNLTLSMSNFAGLHTFYYHWLIVLFISLMLAQKLYTPKFSDMKKVVVCYYSWSLVVTILANVFKTNYAGFYASLVPTLDPLYENLGYFGYLISLYLIYFVGMSLIMFVAQTISKLLSRKKATSSQEQATELVTVEEPSNT